MNEDDEIASMSPGERWNRTPRPLNFVRVRLYGDGQAEYIRNLFEDERDNLMEDLGNLRRAGKAEDDSAIQNVRANLNHLLRALRDIDSGMLELAGWRPEDAIPR